MIRESMKIALIYIGVVVGAGFATGQEIYQFFTKFGNLGFIGAFVATFGFIYFGWLYLKLVYEHNIYNYSDLLKIVIGERGARAIDLMISFFLLGSFTIMVAAAQSLFVEYIFSNRLIAYIIIITITWISLIKGIKGIININEILIPFLILIIFILCSVFLIKDSYLPAFSSLVPRNYLFSSITYVSYNLIIGMVILTSLKKEIRYRETTIIAPLLAGLLLGVMLFLLVSATSYLEFPGELPIMEIAIQINKVMAWLVLTAISIAILTSTVGIGFGLINRLEDKFNISYSKLVILIILISIPLSMYGFSQLVVYVYPFFGYLNLMIMLSSLKFLLFSK